MDSPFLDRVPHLAQIIECILDCFVNSFGMAYMLINPTINPIGANETRVRIADMGVTNPGFKTRDNLRW